MGKVLLMQCQALVYFTKNIQRKDIVMHDVFFNTRGDIVDYLIPKHPKFFYSNVPVECSFEE